jgi:hypothetical protein
MLLFIRIFYDGHNALQTLYPCKRAIMYTLLLILLLTDIQEQVPHEELLELCFC